MTKGAFPALKTLFVTAGMAALLSACGGGGGTTLPSGGSGGVSLPQPLYFIIQACNALLTDCKVLPLKVQNQ